jgi:transporter family protein
MQSWIPPALAAFAFWGVWALLPKFAIRYIDPKSAIIYQAVGVATVALVLAASMEFKPAWDWRGAALAAVTGVLGFTGAIFYLFALSRGPVGLVAVSTALYPGLTILLAYLFLGEPVTLKQGIGLLFALIALVLFAT